ncbi:uncharacterized protein [Eurosta solidaginis]|uniref:uncharacterized protein n=1 Tax=Eurosta solidaginis TaxID=178769 RepID=UPI003531700E
MSKVQRFCGFCLQKSGNLINFNETNLLKCNDILSVRKENNLSSKNVVLPKQINDFELYHAKCYRTLTALPPKYRKREEIVSEIEESEASTSSAKENEQEMIPNPAEDVTMEECAQTESNEDVQQEEELLNETIWSLL